MAQYLPGLTMPAGRHLSDLATKEDDREIEDAYIEVRNGLFFSCKRSAVGEPLQAVRGSSLQGAQMSCIGL